jgi:RNA polymerase sigma factor (sigma-70 family)
MVPGQAIAAAVPATIVASAAAGDADALARIVGAHHDDMARIAYVICGDADLAQDAVQSAWPVAWRKLGSLREPDRLRPWLMAVAANQARMLLRARRRERVVEIDVVGHDAAQPDPAARPELTDLALALSRLSPDDRALLAFRHVAGFDATEIGHALGMSPSGVRSRLARLLSRLREELDHG